MKIRITFALSLFVAVVAFGQPSEEFLKEYINEKIRTPSYNDFMMKVLDLYLLQKEGHISSTEKKEGIEALRSELQIITDFKKTGLELRENTNIGQGAEPCIALNPQNKNQLVATYMTVNDPAIMPIYYSTNGGETWTPSQTSTKSLFIEAVPTSNGNSLGGGDPIVTYDEEGTIHLTFILLDFQQIAYMLYATSDDGGATFQLAQGGTGIVSSGNLFNGAGNVIDREWLASDHSGGVNTGNTYLAGVYFGGEFGSSGIVCLPSKKGQKLFENPVIAIPDNGQFVQFTNLRCAEDGTLHLSCIMGNPQTGAGNAVYSKSIDGGATWSPAKNIGPAETKSPSPFQQKEIHSRENSAVSLAVDGQNVYMTWTHQANNDHIGYMAYSNDGGETWTDPFEFGLENSTSDFYHFFSNVAASKGRVTVSWYEVDKASLESFYKTVEFIDNGSTILTPVTVSEEATNFTGAGSSANKFYGDYNSSVKDSCFTYTIWAEGTNTPTVYIAKIDGCEEINTAVEITPINSDVSLSSVYPTPSSQSIKLSFKADSRSHNFDAQLINVNGNTIRPLGRINVKKGATTRQFDISGQASGIYFIELINEDGLRFVRKVVKH